MTTRISRILRPDRSAVYVDPDVMVIDAVNSMIENDVASIVILTQENELLGIFTERDLLRRVVAPGMDPTTTSISDVMTPSVRVVDTMATRLEVQRLMEEEHIRHVPVVDGNTVVGVISLRDVLRSENADKAFELDQLKGYVTDKPYPSYPA